MQFYYGNSLHRSDLISYSRYVDGRICDSLSAQFRYSLYIDTVTVLLHTDESGVGNRGFELSFKAIGIVCEFCA